MDSNLTLTTAPMKGVVVLSLNRKECCNALSIELVNELRKKLHSLKNDSSLRVLVLKGEGSGFCSGMDLNEALDISLVEESAESLKSLFLELYTFPKITIASVHGFALAGGCGLISACDLVIASEGAKFGFPEIKRGLVPALVSVLVTKQISDRHMRELFLLGDLIEAKDALNCGMITKVVDSKFLCEETLSLAKKSLKSAPYAVSLIKSQLALSLSNEFDEALEMNKKMRTGDEAKEGMSAFLQKRRPDWCQ